MNNLLQEKTIIVNKPKRHAGVYAILNILEKKVYIGETNDFYHRIPEHIIGIFENSNNENQNILKLIILKFLFFWICWTFTTKIAKIITNILKNNSGFFTRPFICICSANMDSNYIIKSATIIIIVHS